SSIQEVEERHPKLEQFVDQDGRLHLSTTKTGTEARTGGGAGGPADKPSTRREEGSYIAQGNELITGFARVARVCCGAGQGYRDPFLVARQLYAHRHPGRFRLQVSAKPAAQSGTAVFRYPGCEATDGRAGNPYDPSRR